MAELRSVDPAALVPNPDNPRRTVTPQAMDDQLVASIKAIGLIQPPRVKEARSSPSPATAA
jgi:ParB-like chromosome segregation protein Spo0J